MISPIKHAAISLAFILVTLGEAISRALGIERARQRARSPEPGHGESGAQDSERAGHPARRPIDF